MKMGRRELFKWGALGGIAGAAAGFGARTIADAKPEEAAPQEAIDDESLCGPDAAQGGQGPGRAYGGSSSPPSYIDPTALDAIHTPPAVKKGAQEIEFNVIEASREIGRGANVEVWSYNGVAPGPTIRATAGDRIKLTLVNNTKHRHSIHFHGSHDVTQDGWQSVQPGARQLYDIEAGPFGLHPYHCHTSPYAWHFSKGMYGVMIVDPPKPRPPAHEFILSLSGWDINNDGKNEIYTWNGIAGFYDRYPLKVPVGELVRLYITNFVEFEPVASFHLHAQTFDVYRSGTSLTPSEHTDVVMLGQTERVIIEFRLPRRGRYMFHPHQIHMAQKGAMGWIVAV